MVAPGVAQVDLEGVRVRQVRDAVQRGGAELVTGGEHPRPKLLLHPMMSAMSRSEPVLVDVPINDGDTLNVLEGATVVHVPGHTPGSVALHFPAERLLISGDAINHRSNRLGPPLAPFTEDMEQAIASILRLTRLDFEVLCPGHGAPIVGGAVEQVRAMLQRLAWQTPSSGTTFVRATEEDLMNDTESPTIAAIFDLDGTLYTGHIAQGIIRHHRTHRVNRLPLYFYMATHIALWPLWRLGLVSETTARELWARHLGWTIRGWTYQEASAAFAWIAKQYVQPLVRPDIMERVRDHQEANHRVILVSGTPTPLLAEIGRRLGIEERVGTPLVLQAGRYTGACELPVCQGPGKVSRLEAHLGSGSIAWSESYAYADSHTDLPLLERVGHAVAVYPDDELVAHAQRRGWKIISGTE